MIGIGLNLWRAAFGGSGIDVPFYTNNEVIYTNNDILYTNAEVY